MQIQEFGYTQNKADVGFNPVLQNTNTAGLYGSRKSKVAEDIDNLVSTALNVGKIAVAVKEEDNKQQYLDVSNKYREAKAQYLEKLSDVNYDSNLYKAHLRQFRDYVEEISKELTPEYQQSLRQSADQFTMYQTFNVEELEKKEKRNTYKDFVTSLMLDSSSLDTKERYQAYSKAIEEAGNHSVTKKEAEEWMLEGQMNAMLIKLGDDKNLDFNTVNSMKGEINKLIEFMPHTKNSETHRKLLSQLSTIEGKVASEYQSKMNLSMSVGDYSTFKDSLNALYNNGNIDKDTRNLLVNKYAKMNVNEEAVAAETAKALFQRTGGDINVTALENTGQIDSKTARILKQYLTADAEQAITQGNDLGKIKNIQLNNPAIFNSIISRRAKESINETLINVDNPKLPTEERDKIKQQVFNQISYFKNFNDALSTDVKEDLFMLETILNSPVTQGQVNEIFQKTKSASYKDVNINDKGFIEATKDLPLSSDEKTKALKLYSISKHYTTDEDKIKEGIKNVFNPRVVNDNIIVGNSISSNIPASSSEKADEYIVPVLKDLLINSGKNDMADKVQKLVDSDGKVFMEFDKNTLVIRNGLEQVLIPMSQENKDIYNKQLESAYGKPPGAISNVLNYAYNEILVEDTLKGVWNKYLIGPSGDRFFNSVDTSANAVGDFVGGAYEEVGQIKDHAINNFYKTMDKLSDTILNRQKDKYGDKMK